jgi:hypothetical protein
MAKPTPSEREALIEAVVTAHRGLDPRGEIEPSAAFFDLEEADRLRAFEQASNARMIEAGLDAEGRSTTVRAVLRMIAGE